MKGANDGELVESTCYCRALLQVEFASCTGLHDGQIMLMTYRPRSSLHAAFMPRRVADKLADHQRERDNSLKKSMKHCLNPRRFSSKPCLGLPNDIALFPPGPEDSWCWVSFVTPPRPFLPS